MKTSFRQTISALPVSTLKRLDEVCDRFETAWLANERPRLEDFLGEAAAGERAAILGELLKLELDYRKRRGEIPLAQDYEFRFPEQAQVVRGIFAANATPPSPPSNADANLLFGVFALQMDFITRDELIGAMNAWIIDKSKPLGQILQEQGRLSAQRRKLLDRLLKEHLSAHNHNAQRSLEACAALNFIHHDLISLNDAEVQSSLSRMSGAASGDNSPGSVLDNQTTQDEVRPAGARYRILSPHAEGGLGEVFLAEDLELHRQVALKKIQPQYAHDPYSRVRFLLEAKITGGLEHPGIVPVYGMGLFEDGQPYYAMRLIKGGNLKEAIARFHEAEKSNRDPGERSLAFRQLLSRFIAVCNSVAYAHSRGVLHRDLKPSNILLGKYGESLVVDWGLAKIVGRQENAHECDEMTLHPSSSDEISTQFGVTLGTLGYMSPEQAAGHLDQLGPASDIYSLGATLYILLTGQVSIPNSGKLEMLERTRKGDWLPPRQVKKETPAALDAICCKAMALRPEDRYATALDLAADVEKWLADEPVKAHRESYADQASRWMRRHRTGVTAAVGNVLLMAAYREAEKHPHQSPAKYYSNLSESKELRAHVLEPMRRRLLEKALDFYQQFMQEESDPAFPSLLANLYQAERGRAYSRLADLYSVIGRHEQAEEAYRHALAILQSLVKARPHVPEYKKDLAGNFNNLGALYSDTGRNRKAKAAYQKALVIQKKLVQANPHIPEYQRDLAGCYNNLGVLIADIGKYGPSHKVFQKSLTIRKRLASARPHAPEFQTDLAAVYINLGATACKCGRWNQAKAAFDRALAVQKKLAESQPETIEYLVDLGATYSNLGEVMKALGKLSLSVTHYSMAVQWLQQVLEKQPRLGSAQRFLHYAFRGQALALALLGRHTEAVRAAEEAGQPHLLTDRDHFDLAVVFSLAAAAAERDSRISRAKSSNLTKQYASRAVEFLERISGNGFFQESDNVGLLMDERLDYLRERLDFNNLKTQSEKKKSNS
jgi:serine/threonine-protein kinase